MIDIFTNFRQVSSKASIQFLATEKVTCRGNHYKSGQTVFQVNYLIKDSNITLEYVGCNKETVFTELFEGINDDFQNKKTIGEILRGDLDLINPKFSAYRVFLGKTTPFFSFTGNSYMWGSSTFLTILKEKGRSVFSVIPYNETIYIDGNAWWTRIKGDVHHFEVLSKKNQNFPRFFDNNKETSALHFTEHLKEEIDGEEFLPMTRAKSIIQGGIERFFPETKVAANPAASQRFLNELIQMRTQVNQGQTDLVIQRINEYISAITTSKIIIQDKRNQ